MCAVACGNPKFPQRDGGPGSSKCSGAFFLILTFYSESPSDDFPDVALTLGWLDLADVESPGSKMQGKFTVEIAQKVQLPTLQLWEIPEIPAHLLQDYRLSSH